MNEKIRKWLTDHADKCQGCAVTLQFDEEDFKQMQQQFYDMGREVRMIHDCGFWDIVDGN